MTSPDTPRPDILRSDMEALAATLDDARAGVAAGDALDLTGMDERVGGLCAAVASLPRDEARALTVGLERLLDVLGALAATIDERRQAAAAEQDQTARRRAAAAYGRPAPLSVVVPVPFDAPSSAGPSGDRVPGGEPPSDSLGEPPSNGFGEPPSDS